MNTDSPFEGDVPDGGDEPSYKWLDEWLCEYVDGTMDPSLEAVFEKYVEANPELKAHVERLKETRELLCNCGLSADTTPEIETEDVCPDEAGDRPPAPTSERKGPVATIGGISSVATALVVGFLVGAMTVGPLPSVDVSYSSGPVQKATEAESSFPEGTQKRPDARPFAPLHEPAVVPDSNRGASTVIPIGSP